MEVIKKLKIFTNLFYNKAQYLYYDKDNELWYFLTDVTKEGLGSSNTGNIVLSEVKFLNDFKDIFFEKFGFLFETINKEPNKYFIDVKNINSYLNKCTEKNKIDFTSIDINEFLIFVNIDIPNFIKKIKDKIDTEAFVTIPLTKSIDVKGVTLIDVRKTISINNVSNSVKNIFVPFKNGYCVGTNYIKNKSMDEFYLKLYTSNCKTYSYSIVYKNEEVEIESIQPFHIFINN